MRSILFEIIFFFLILHEEMAIITEIILVSEITNIHSYESEIVIG